MRQKRSLILALALVLSLVVSLAQGQGYGASDDDDLPQQKPQQTNQFPQNQQISSLPQYESSENAQQTPVAAPPQNQQQQQPQQQGNSPQNLWWMGQNAFQRPPGHPGVEMLAPKNPGGQQQPQQGNYNNNRSPNAYNPPAPGFNAYGGGQQQQPPQQQFNNPTPQQPAQEQFNNPAPQQPPQQQYNNPAPQKPPQQQYTNPPPQQPPQQQQYNNPPSQQPPQQQYNNPPPQQPPQQQQYNNPPPEQQPPQQHFNNPPPQQPPQQQFNNPPPPPQQQQPSGIGGGWNAPQQPAQQPAFGQPVEAPGCELVNKADCHNNPQGQQPPQNNFNPQGSGAYNVPKPPQNYQPPPYNPQPFPQQPPQQPPPQYQQPQQQPPVPQPNQGYRPPPPQQPSYNQNQPSYNRPSQPPQQQRPYTPPQAPRPQQQFQNSGQGVRPNNQPQQPAEEQVPYPGCPAAMLCVQDDYCNTIGIVEENPIQLSAADKLHRVALMQCSEPMTGVVGVCCRDPNYKDPWPDMQGGGMMKKDGGAHQHHPVDKGQGQSSGNGFAPQQSPQGNHLSGGNAYSGTKTQGVTSNSSNRVAKNIINSAGPSSSQSQLSHLSESKQTLQVLEPCTSDELCISMSQCFSLNPQFMVKTGLHPAKSIKSSNNSTEPVKVKRCKYERSGIQYLCCKKPELVTRTTSATSPLPLSTRRPITFSNTQYFSYTPSIFTKVTPRPFASTTPTRSSTIRFTSPFSFATASGSTIAKTSIYSSTLRPSTSTTTKSSLIHGIGLRFHSNLHTAQQKELNNKKPNPYAVNNEESIILIKPTTSSASTPSLLSSRPVFIGTKAPHSFRFTTTTPPTMAFGTGSPTKVQTVSTVPVINIKSQPEANLARVHAGGSTVTPTTSFGIEPTGPQLTSPPTTPTATTPITSVTKDNIGRQVARTQSSSTSSGTITTTPTSTAVTSNTTNNNATKSVIKKVDITRIPVPVPLREEFKEEPPIGFIFKGDDLYIPEVEIPSQNYLVPTFDFEERTLPTEPPPVQEQTTQTMNSTESSVELTTTRYTLLDDQLLDNSAG